MIGDAVRWATTKVDATVVSPVAQLLAQSVANPYVLSVLIWDRLKRMTPQRARDLTRLLSTALGNALGVLGAERAKQLAGTASRLQDQFVHASVSRPGREVVLNSVATASRVAQALSTPESKQATRQLFSTVQSIVDFFASPEGRGIFETLGECLAQLGDVAASPEASIFLAELATNLLHALEVERLRREQTQEEAATARAKTDATAEEPATPDEYEEKAPAVEVKEEVGVELGELHVSDEKPLASPASSVAETRWSFETESAFSDAASMRYRNSMTPSTTPQTPMYAAAGAMPSPSPRDTAESPSPADIKAERSARIEKEVLLRMGVDPSMLSEIQRVLDQLAEEEAARQRRLAGLDSPEEEDVAGLAIPEAIGEEEEDAGISFAFGIRSSSLPDLEEEKKTEKQEPPSDPADVLLPEWNTSAVHDALRRRHVQTTEVAEEREISDAPAREFASALAQRRVQQQQQQGGGEMTAADLAACRVIAQMLVVGFGVVVAMTCYFILRSLSS